MAPGKPVCVEVPVGRRPSRAHLTLALRYPDVTAAAISRGTEKPGLTSCVVRRTAWPLGKRYRRAWLSAVPPPRYAQASSRPDRSVFQTSRVPSAWPIRGRSRMRRHSVDVVPLVLLRKTPNEGPDAESYTTMSPALAAMSCAIGYMLEAPVWAAASKSHLAMPTRGRCSGAARHLTPTCNFACLCGAAASPIAGAPNASCTCAQRPRPRP